MLDLLHTTYSYELFYPFFAHRIIKRRIFLQNEQEGKVVAKFNAGRKTNREDISKDRFQKMIAERAYCKAEKRGFVAGHEMEDWLEAEWEIRNQYFYWFQDIE